MKYKILLPFLLSSCFLFGQKPSNFSYKQSNRHEVKFNSTLALFGVSEISYEYMLNKKSSIGLSVAYTINKSDLDLDFDPDFYLLPHYRRFLGRRKPSGLFVEANFMFFKESSFFQTVINQEVENFGIGIGGAMGYKLSREDGLTVDIILGSLGNLNKENTNAAILPRFGVSIGKRFPRIEEDKTIIESKTSEKAIKSNELKLNLAFITYGIPAISYERILNKSNSIGISFAYSLTDNQNERIFILPHYRFYFGEKEANGFFVELGAMLWQVNFPDYHNIETTMGFGGEMAIGLKIRKIPNFPVELVAGFARSYINEDILFTEYLPRFGLSIGRQF